MPPLVGNGAGDAEPIVFVVDEVDAGERLDRVLVAQGLEYSRSTLKRFIDQGRVQVDGVVLPAKARIAAGARVVVRPAPPPPSAALPEAIPLVIVYEDSDLLVVDKPAGLVVHPAPGHPAGTLVNAVLHHLGGFEGAVDPVRPGIVHRLDKDTSGVMVVAKTPTAHEVLVTRFAAREIERAYVGLCQGHPPAMTTFDTFIGRHPKDRKRFTSLVPRGKRAVTRVTVQERLHGAALIECRLETGRTHQIRVHLSDGGYPLLGDPVYGRKIRDPRVGEASVALGRQALHARLLGFAHPVTGEALRFEALPPPDFEAAVAALRDS